MKQNQVKVGGTYEVSGYLVEVLCFSPSLGFEVRFTSGGTTWVRARVLHEIGASKAPVQIHPYDILQVNRGEGWIDYSTLRDSRDFSEARRICIEGADGLPANRFRVITDAGCKNTVILEGVAQ